jgi:hypothetical protein
MLCVFYYGDDKPSTLAQETLPIGQAMEGYSRRVLLKHDEIPSWCDLSEKDEKLADVIALPTQNNLFAQLIDLTEKGYYIDLFICTHGNSEQFKLSAGKPGSGDWVTNNDINEGLSPAKTGFSRIPIRMQWGTNCWGSTLGNNWRSIGAQATAGARHVNFYPGAFGPFIREWNKGNVPFKSAVEDSDTDAVRTAAQLYISTVHAPSHNDEWGKCPFGTFVLGENDCSRRYFTTMWGIPWQSGSSGKENMNHSSYMVLGGNTSITKNTRPSW